MSDERETDSLGIGLVKITHFYNSKFLTFYNDSALTEKFITWDIFNPSKKYFPKYYKPDYDLCYFICLDETESYYKILINKSLVKFLPRKKNYIFEDWETHLMTSRGIRPKNWQNKKTLKIFTAPEESRKPFSTSIEDFFCMIEMQGEWIKVKAECNSGFVYCTEIVKDCKNGKIGWIRWRKGEKLLIDIFLLC